MTNWEGIHDERSLEAWLADRPREVAVAIAARAALRVMPFWTDFCETDAARERDLVPLPVLRSGLTNSVAAASPTEKKSAASIAISPTARVYTSAEDTLAFLAASAIASSLSSPARSAADAASAADYVPTTMPPGTQADPTAARDMWSAVRHDAREVAGGASIPTSPLWPGDNPLQDNWEQTRIRWSLPDSPFDFWRRWYDSLLAGTPMNPDLLYQIALIPDETWDAGPEAVAEAIREIEADFDGGGDTTETALARAYLFDFVEHDRKLRMAGVDLDFEGQSPEEIEKCLRALRDWKDLLFDWRDFVRNALAGRNEPCNLDQAARKIIDLIESIEEPKEFPAGRLVSMGRDLRLVALNEAERDLVGETYATMMDDRIDDLSRLLGSCFGHVLARLEPLEGLELGDESAADLIDLLQQAMAKLREVDPQELVALDKEVAAAFAEMIRELEELRTSEAEANSDAQKEVLRKRFASRWGAFVITFGQRLKKGVELAEKASKPLDEAAKWIKRSGTALLLIEALKALLGLPL